MKDDITSATPASGQGRTKAAREPAAAAKPRAEGLARFDAHGIAPDLIARYHDDPDFVTALARGLSVMLALSDKRRRVTIAQVAHLTGIPRAAARRSLHTLVKLGFVTMDDARRFYLRPRVLSFSHAYLSASPIAVLSQPILDRLSDETREACSLAVLDGEEIVYVARSASSRIMSPSLNVGRRLPAFCTSVGHVLLAELPPSELDDFLAHVRFVPYTEHTVNSPDALRAILRRTHEHGYSFTSGQIERRLATLAVPVRDTGGHYVAGINVILQGRPVTAEQAAEQFLRPLQDAAMELGSLLLP
ncbi:MAG: IclR family transcriptional regulator C-terminal domain-containing protein [Burkholderiales bacterium]